MQMLSKTNQIETPGNVMKPRIHPWRHMEAPKI